MLTFEGFLDTVDPKFRDFAILVHSAMLSSGCRIKLQTAKNGEYIVSYQHGKSKRVVLNFVFRKIGLVARIYGDNVGSYANFLETLPEKMVNEIEKSSSECKLCNLRCLKGYDFSIGEKHFFRCRYNCFMFSINDESIPFVQNFLEKELKARNS